ncbi:MAG: DUF3137 domain-containing protein [Alphaproteobacteria bacterium]|nr:DUF3137 domain-containing protein [Alphaproteobacteria bacterium]
MPKTTITSSTIAKLETLRRQHLRKWVRDVALIVAALSASFYYETLGWRPNELFAFIFIICIIALPFAVIWQPSRYRKTAKAMTWPHICESFRSYQLQYHQSKRDSLTSAKVVQKLYNGMFDSGNAFKGRYKEYGFEIVETALTSGSGRHRITHFRGLVIGIIAQALFPAQTLVVKKWDYPSFRYFDGIAFNRIKLDDKFEKAYSTFADNETSARQMLTAEKTDRIMAVANRVKKAGYRKQPEFAFMNQGLFLFVPTSKNHFQLGYIWNKIDRTRTFKHAVKDIEAAIGLIEMLQQEKLLPAP